MNVNSRGEAARKALRENWITISDITEDEEDSEEEDSEEEDSEEEGSG
jgi:hypothetical protein